MDSILAHFNRKGFNHFCFCYTDILNQIMNIKIPQKKIRYKYSVHIRCARMILLITFSFPELIDNLVVNITRCKWFIYDIYLINLRYQKYWASVLLWFSSTVMKKKITQCYSLVSIFIPLSNCKLNLTFLHSKCSFSLIRIFCEYISLSKLISSNKVFNSGQLL